MFYYVYFLKSLSSSFRYVGYKNNLRKRLNEHNNGLNPALGL
jgi:predicted GIY-YIG superfamily endonuclease